MFRLLYRFYNPSSGRILIDGQPIDDLTLESVRKAIGVVPQDTPLFHADVMHNVRYGRLEATDGEVISATKQARVHDAIMRLPDRYATTVGERGLMISGGEKQRLAVARVLLKDPSILFFDEAVRSVSAVTVQLYLITPQTSALDAHTEFELMNNINSLLKGQARTSIFIAHRLKTVVEAGTSYVSAHVWSRWFLNPRITLDLILVFKDGIVVEQGTHEELLQRGGLYFSMWIQQSSDSSPVDSLPDSVEGVSENHASNSA